MQCATVQACVAHVHQQPHSPQRKQRGLGRLPGGCRLQLLREEREKLRAQHEVAALKGLLHQLLPAGMHCQLQCSRLVPCR